MGSFGVSRKRDGVRVNRCCLTFPDLLAIVQLNRMPAPFTACISYR